MKGKNFCVKAEFICLLIHLLNKRRDIYILIMEHETNNVIMRFGVGVLEPPRLVDKYTQRFLALHIIHSPSSKRMWRESLLATNTRTSPEFH